MATCRPRKLCFHPKGPKGLKDKARKGSELADPRLQEPVRRWLEDSNFSTAQRALRCIEEADDSLVFLILFRFLMLPIWLRNYGPASLDIPIWKLLVAALPHCAWISLMFASLGMSLQDAEEMLSSGHLRLWDAEWQNVLMFIVSLATSLLISLYSYRKYRDLMSDEGAHLLKEP